MTSLNKQLEEAAAYNRAYYDRVNRVARPRRNRLAWSTETYRLVIRGEITEDEADARTAASRETAETRP